MLSLCSHKAACSAKTNYRLKPMIKTTLGLLSSCFNCSLCSRGDPWIQNIFLSAVSADTTAENKGFQASVFSKVHKTFTLVPHPHHRAQAIFQPAPKGFLTRCKKGEETFIEISLNSFKTTNSNSVTRRKSCNKILSPWYPTSSCCSVYIKPCGTCRKPDRLKSWCLLSRTHLTLGSHAIFLGCLHSC